MYTLANPISQERSLCAKLGVVRCQFPWSGQHSSKQLSQGAGNAAFPLLSANKNPQLAIRAYDYSSHAVKLVQASIFTLPLHHIHMCPQNNPLYANPPTGSIQAAVWDLTSENSLPPGVDPETVDIVLCVFVLSALHPDEWGKATANIHRVRGFQSPYLAHR